MAGRKWPRRIFSGTCKCGHPWQRHHLQMIVNMEALAELEPGEPAYLAGACLKYGFNETAGLDSEGNPHCFGYEEA